MRAPARSLDRACEYWQQHGRSEKWIQQRMMGQETRKRQINSVEITQATLHIATAL